MPVSLACSSTFLLPFLPAASALPVRPDKEINEQEQVARNNRGAKVAGVQVAVAVALGGERELEADDEGVVHDVVDDDEVDDELDDLHGRQVLKEGREKRG